MHVAALASCSIAFINALARIKRIIARIANEIEIGIFEMLTGAPKISPINTIVKCLASVCLASGISRRHYCGITRRRMRRGVRACGAK